MPGIDGGAVTNITHQNIEKENPLPSGNLHSSVGEADDKHTRYKN